MDEREIWFQLLVRLEHVLLETERPIAHKIYKHLGRNCLKNARNQLLKERDELLKILGRWGSAIAVSEVRKATYNLSLKDDLAEGYFALSAEYRRAGRIAERRGNLVVAKWLRVRADIHDLQSSFLRC